MKEITGFTPQELQAQLDSLTSRDTVKNLHHSREGREHHFSLSVETDPNIEENEKSSYLSTEHMLGKLLERPSPQLTYDHRSLVDFVVRRDLVSTGGGTGMAIIVTLISHQSDQNHEYRMAQIEVDDNEYEVLANLEGDGQAMIARPFKLKGKKYKLVIEEGLDS